MEISRLYLKHKSSVNSPKFRGKSFAKSKNWTKTIQETQLRTVGNKKGETKANIW